MFSILPFKRDLDFTWGLALQCASLGVNQRAFLFLSNHACVLFSQNLAAKFETRTSDLWPGGKGTFRRKSVFQQVLRGLLLSWVLGISEELDNLVPAKWHWFYRRFGSCGDRCCEQRAL